MNADGSNQRQLTADHRGELEQPGPIFSTASGTRIVFSTSTNGPSTLETIQAGWL
jgi:hypothetical protein